MSQETPRYRPSLYTQIDVTQAAVAPPSGHLERSHDAEQTVLLRELLVAQDRQNELLEELINQFTAAQKQRAAELSQWKEANPRLARSCREAAESLGKVQTEFLASIAREIADNGDVFMDGEFMLNEFVDRFGPRLAHLNGLLQVLSQLSATPNSSNTQELS